MCERAKLPLLCLNPCDSMDYSPPGSSVHGTLQARILEWVAVPSSRRSSQCSDRICILCLLHWQAGFFFFLSLVPPGKHVPTCSLNSLFCSPKNSRWILVNKNKLFQTHQHSSTRITSERRVRSS